MEGESHEHLSGCWISLPAKWMYRYFAIPDLSGDGQSKKKQTAFIEEADRYISLI